MVVAGGHNIANSAPGGSSIG